MSLLSLPISFKAAEKRGKPQRRFMDVLKEGMQRVGVTEG